VNPQLIQIRRLETLIQVWLNLRPLSFIDRLVSQSSLTPRQVQSLASYLRVASGEIKLREAASLSSQGKQKGSREKPLSIGSYYRTVSQAKSNIREAVVTVVIALWMGMIKGEDVRRLFELLSSGARELSEEEAERFVEILQVILARIIS
jgi:hypothetical protein